MPVDREGNIMTNRDQDLLIFQFEHLMQQFSSKETWVGLISSIVSHQLKYISFSVVFKSLHKSSYITEKAGKKVTNIFFPFISNHWACAKIAYCHTASSTRSRPMIIKIRGRGLLKIKREFRQNTSTFNFWG